MLRISLSQTPLACEAFGGWKTQLASLLQEFILNLLLVPALNGLSNLSLSTDKVHSIARVDGLGWASSVHKPFQNVDEAIRFQRTGQLQCTALEFRPVNIAPHVLTMVLPLLTFKGPK